MHVHMGQMWECLWLSVCVNVRETLTSTTTRSPTTQHDSARSTRLQVNLPHDQCGHILYIYVSSLLQPNGLVILLQEPCISVLYNLVVT